MKFFVVLISVLILMSGCGSTQKKVKKYIPPQEVRGLHIGENIYYYNNLKLVNVLKASKSYKKLPQKVEEMLLKKNFIAKSNHTYTINKLQDIKIANNTRNLYFFKYSQDRNEYAISSKYTYEYEILKEKFTRSIGFVALYDAQTFNFKGMYYKKYDHAGINASDDLKYIFFGINNYGENGAAGAIIDRTKEQAYRIKILNNFKGVGEKEVKFSKNKKYMALLMSDFDYRPEFHRHAIRVVDAKNAQTIEEFRDSDHAYVSDKNYAYGFSDDENLFFYKMSTTNFKVYDIKNKKEINSFGQIKSKTEQNTDVKIDVSGKYASAYYRDQDNKKNTIYIFDAEEKKLICKSLTTKPYKYVFEYKNTINYLFEDKQEIYVVHKGECINVRTINRGWDYKSTNSYVKDGLIYTLDKQKITTFEPVKIEIAADEIRALDRVKNLKRLFIAGLSDRAIVEFRDMILNDNYDYYANTDLSFLPKKYFSYSQVLAFKKYKKEGKIPYEPIKKYIYIASAHGFSDLILPMVQEYEKLIEPNPTKYQKDLLALYKATYLLNIGKDKEAYTLLFESAPLHEDAKTVAKLFSATQHSFIKDRKKLLAALDLKNSDLYEKPLVLDKETKIQYMYDLDENLLKRRD